MVDWARVRDDLSEAGYDDFAMETGETAVPGLSRERLAGSIERTGNLRRESLPLPWRFLDAIPDLAALPTDPERIPDDLRRVADRHGLDVVILTTTPDAVGVALCEKPRETRR